MPIYVYEVILEDGRGGDRFEVLQSYNDPELKQHPETGQPVRRIIQAPRVAGKWSDLKTKSTLSDRNLADKGFTKYVKTDQGRYEKTTGAGPDRISGD